MKAWIILVLLIALSGCTTYDVKRAPDGSVEVHVSSTRSFEAPDLEYRRTGPDAEFSFSAATVDNNTDAFLNMFSGMMQMMQAMMVQMATPPAQ